MNIRVDCLSKDENALYDVNVGSKALTIEEDSNKSDQPRIHVPVEPVNLSTLNSIMKTIERGIQDKREKAILVVKEQKMGVLVL